MTEQEKETDCDEDLRCGMEREREVPLEQRRKSRQKEAVRGVAVHKLVERDYGRSGCREKKNSPERDWLPNADDAPPFKLAKKALKVEVLQYRFSEEKIAGGERGSRSKGPQPIARKKKKRIAVMLRRQRKKNGGGHRSRAAERSEPTRCGEMKTPEKVRSIQKENRGEGPNEKRRGAKRRSS